MALPLGPPLRGLGSNPGFALDLTRSHNLSDSQFLPLGNGQDTASALQVKGWGEGFSLQQIPFLGDWTEWGQRGPEGARGGQRMVWGPGLGHGRAPGLEGPCRLCGRCCPLVATRSGSAHTPTWTIHSHLFYGVYHRAGRACVFVRGLHR